MGIDAVSVSRPPRLGPVRVRVELGLFAFAPAMGLLAVRARHQSWWWLVFAVPAAFGCVVAIGAAVVVRRAEAEPVTFTAIDDVGSEIVGHIGSYVLPVVVDVHQSLEQILVAGIALALIVQIHIATGRVHVDPLLSLCGFRTYRATTETGSTYYLAARSDPADWVGPRPWAALGSSVLVERRRAPPREPSHEKQT